MRQSAQLVLAFGATSIVKRLDTVQEIQKLYPKAHILGCSTAGEICGVEVFDDSLVCTAIEFAHTQIRTAKVSLDKIPDSQQAGQFLAQALPVSIQVGFGQPEAPLAHVLVLSDGLSVNGSGLLRGLIEFLPPQVAITGGLAGDSTRFEETWVMTSELSERRAVSIIGLYGPRLKIGFGSLGGWDPFGPDRLVTRSRENVLFELDQRPALGLYKQYLGEHAIGLPATAFLFPLSVRISPGSTPLVRTILAVDERSQSMTFAGDIPEGSFARLTRSNVNRLVDGAIGAAQASRPLGGVNPELALLISCVGRKLVLKQRVEEELDGVRDVLGKHATMAGFYSYGEIAPFALAARSELHNQTMTVTTFAEDCT